MKLGISDAYFIPRLQNPKHYRKPKFESWASSCLFDKEFRRMELSENQNLTIRQFRITEFTEKLFFYIGHRDNYWMTRIPHHGVYRKHEFGNWA